MRLIAFFSVCLIAATAHGQGVLRVLPPNPTSVDNIFITVEAPYADFGEPVVQVSGTQINIVYRGYVSLPAFRRDTVSVRLAPGNYTIVVRYEYLDTEDQVYLVSTAPPFSLIVVAGFYVPALDARGLALLAAALSLVALRVILPRSG